MANNSTTEKIVSLIFNLGRSIRKQIKEEGEMAGELSILQIEALRFVRDEKDVLMKDLAKYLFIAPPSATSIVDDLVKGKFVVRSEDKDDRRNISVSLTPKGKRALEDCLRKKMEKVVRKIDLLSSGEKKTFLSLLEKLSKEQN
ncbi:MAG TPA: MarR family transcriptional regulator [Candidatus Bathyarchaeia archaeon]|nr:MarR family transcriptional regulator [Candidatus Bathyarchaeia archaeon]